MFHDTKPATPAHAAIQTSTKPTRKSTGFEPRAEAEDTGTHREMKAFAFIVGLCVLCLVLYELTSL